MLFTIRLDDPWFDYVQDGVKKYHGCCYWKSALRYKIGDGIRFCHQKDPENHKSFHCIIKSIQIFPTFEHALQCLPLEDVLPDITTIEEGIDIFLQFIPLQDQLTNKICMIELEKFESDSDKADLIFPVTKVFNDLRRGKRYASAVTKTAAVYTTAVLEYICSEVVSEAGFVTRDNKRTRITPHFIHKALQNDPDLHKLLSNVTLSGDAVLPNIHALPKHESKDSAS